MEPSVSTLALREQLNLSTALLSKRLPVLRAGDPLGLGRARPAAPADPDQYDRAREEAEGSRSLVPPAERAALDSEMLTIAQVRSIIAENCTRGSLESSFDPELAVMIDSRTDYKIFITEDTIYTREELYRSFPFHEFGIQPEAVFAQQEIGVFSAKSGTPAKSGTEYAMRDAGDERLAFSMPEDLVRAACGGPPPRVAHHIVTTRIYIGREAWSDFILQQRFYRGAIRIAAASGGALPAPESSTRSEERAELSEERIELSEERAELSGERIRLSEVHSDASSTAGSEYEIVAILKAFEARISALERKAQK